MHLNAGIKNSTCWIFALLTVGKATKLTGDWQGMDGKQQQPNHHMCQKYSISHCPWPEDPPHQIGEHFTVVILWSKITPTENIKNGLDPGSI